MEVLQIHQFLVLGSSTTLAEPLVSWGRRPAIGNCIHYLYDYSKVLYIDKMYSRVNPSPALIDYIVVVENISPTLLTSYPRI